MLRAVKAEVAADTVKRSLYSRAASIAAMMRRLRRYCRPGRADGMSKMLTFLAGHPIHDRGGTTKELNAELAQLRKDNPVGTEKYKQPAVQKRIMEINEQLYPGGAVGQGGRTA